MSRKPNVATTSNDEEKILDVVENADNAEVKGSESEKSEKAKTKLKEIKDDEMVLIKNDGLKNRKVYTTDIKNPIIFDENGTAEVIGVEAKRLLEIPGYVRG